MVVFIFKVVAKTKHKLGHSNYRCQPEEQEPLTSLTSTVFLIDLIHTSGKCSLKCDFFYPQLRLLLVNVDEAQTKMVPGFLMI